MTRPAFRLATGATAGEALIPAARFLFESETIAIPVAGPFADYAKATDPFADLAAWAAHPGPLTQPPLVWIAATQSAATGAKSPRTAGPFEWCRARACRSPWCRRSRSTARGSTPPPSPSSPGARSRCAARPGPPGEFVARTLWPEDWRLDRAAPPVALSAIAHAQARHPRPRCAAPRAAAPARLPKPIRSGSANRATAIGPAARCSPSCSTAHRATTTRRGAGTSRIATGRACPPTGGSPTSSSPISTRSTRKARRASFPRPCRSTITSPT